METTNQQNNMASQAFTAAGHTTAQSPQTAQQQENASLSYEQQFANNATQWQNVRHNTTYTMPPYGYYMPPQAPKKKPSTGLIVFIVISVCILVFGCSAMVGLLVNRSAADKSSSDEAQADISEEIDSLDENALKPGVDSGNNDLVIRFDTKKHAMMDATGISEQAENSVLGISVYNTHGILEGEASGIVAGINSQKTKTYIITCAHVVTDVEDGVFKIADKNGKEYLAAVVGYDVSCDVAVLSVEKTGFKTARFGDSETVKAGQTVIAIGNPGGSEFFGSVTQGIVSATDRMVVSTDNSIKCIQHDAAINPGSSGGALFNVYGQVIGINYSKIAEEYYESMNFAIPTSTVVEIANKIIATSLKTRGVKIGIEYYVSASYFDENYKQLVIHAIDEKSDLYAKAEKGDFIIAVNGEKIKDKYTIVEYISGKQAGDSITLTIAHKNDKDDKYETKEVTVRLIEK